MFLTTSGTSHGSISTVNSQNVTQNSKHENTMIQSQLCGGRVGVSADFGTLTIHSSNSVKIR
jgi:hypothetical protein